MKKEIKKQEKKLTAEELIKWAKKEKRETVLLEWAHYIKALEELSENTQFTDEAIKGYEEMMKEMEEALQYNVEYFSDKLRCEVALASIKEKKGWFFNLIRNYTKYKLKKSINKPPKKLNKDSRKFLEEKIEKHKRIITIWKEYKKKKLKS